MAAVTVPAGHSLLGKIAGVASVRARLKGRTSKLGAAVSEHLMTVAAFGAGVADAFLHGGTLWGLAVLVPSLLILDYAIRG